MLKKEVCQQCSKEMDGQVMSGNNLFPDEVQLWNGNWTVMDDDFWDVRKVMCYFAPMEDEYLVAINDGVPVHCPYNFQHNPEEQQRLTPQ